MNENIRIWDIFVRVFHWTLVVTVFIALMTEDDLMKLHVYVGYAAGILIVLRILWGIIGPKYARFTNFVYAPSTVISYLKDMKKHTARRYLGHSPAGGAMVIILMIMIAVIVATGLAVYTGDATTNPYLTYFVVHNSVARNIIGEIHGALAGTLWALIAFHVAGVIYTSLTHRENLVRSMITGLKRRD